MTSLNVSGCTALTTLSVNMNKLTSLDVSDCISLDYLFCPANQLTSLDVSRNTALTELCCGNNQLTSLDVTGLRELKVLCCSGNPLKSLDLTDNPYLVEVAKRGKDTYPRYQVTRKTYKRCVLEFSDTIEITANGQTLYAPPQDPVSIKKCKIGDIADQTYTGRAIKPVPMVKDGEKTLKAGTDYKVRYSANKDIPPTAEIEGVDLVTEGVITINKVLEYGNDYLQNNDSYETWGYKNDGASRICQLLFEEATDINFYVGRAVNPAHQNPDLPITFNIKMNLVKELSEVLTRMGKRIKVSYF